MLTIEDSVALYQAAIHYPDNIKALSQKDLKILSIALEKIQDHMKHHKLPARVSPVSIDTESNRIINILKRGGQPQPEPNILMSLCNRIGMTLGILASPEELVKRVKLLEKQQMALTNQKLHEIKSVIADRQQKLVGLQSLQKLFQEPTFQRMLDTLKMEFKEIVEDDKGGKSLITCTKKLNELVKELNILLEGMESHFKTDAHNYVVHLKSKIDEWNTLLHNNFSRNDFDNTLKMINDNINSMVNKVAIDKEKNQEKIEKLHDMIKFSEHYLNGL